MTRSAALSIVNKIKGAKKFALSEGVKTLEVDCFRNTEIIEITLPKSLETILNNSFNGCKQLTSVTL